MMAGGEGFEPPIDFHLCRFSRPVHSTTLPPTRKRKCWLRDAGSKVFYKHVQGVFFKWGEKLQPKWLTEI